MKFDIKEEDMIIKPYKHEGPIYIREQKGFFQRIRRNLGWLLMLTFILIPWIPYKGQQAVLLDVASQKFAIFGLTLLPQDFMILALLFMLGAFALFFVTNWLGRVWCGYTCPQTIWMLMFSWVEQRIEGTRNQRIKLDKSAWTLSKWQKKTIKHSAWLIISLFTATSFMAYFIPAKSLYGDMFTLQWSGITSFWVFLFAFCTYGNAGFLREKMCTIACPYSRFQAVMFDKDTLLVTYDSARGESRGPRKRKADPKALDLGDCVDCNLCVEVCPAGIDIRNGLQYECINCGLCIDACDDTMDKFGYQKGLIKYASEKQMAGEQTNPYRLKLVGYGALTVLLMVSMLAWLVQRTPIEVSVLRDRNALYRVNYEGLVENPYTLTIINKTQQLLHYRVAITGLDVAKLQSPQLTAVEPGQMKRIPVTVVADGYDLPNKLNQLDFVITAEEDRGIKASISSVFYRN
ncbi:MULTISPECIES: cytochrome c oxidase accessory protein CcoG [Pseudoalteromonas]|jgi:cytochrome c oxidase accessory protein FixG|uniref:Cytochrome c oxidase accessory protein CcoG n=3 Tax=Pseudoalteromonas TaxID=53246 RepID=A0ABY3FHW3_9GAMM|nr:MULTISPECIES: cytochrome c oxidase accessory protein CcoG [Pseudoalteromonas]MBB1300404.1 cytochrome c oxidase accessory protein CcoG [Pseudoalteromonas sp. SR44-8]MBB1308315.1 cytochrome c oxidase accessory protein CcoG [Pseudoalteromonas sp. SR41-8]MBB1397427.1 cytochrome c oxidase accessory protein CcoG [Pseudoalteromonas sp. SG44-8]MBB1408972.1 cytochrome c oxidase accessory protein CcoG [Pseudoalteromonas sp. SG44-17]TVU85962.1 cytochrome c oxidase accessory protein CcoG [Pseudoalterom